MRWVSALRGFVAVGGVALLGCGDGGSPSEPPEETRGMNPISGDLQVGLTGVPLRDSLVVRLTDGTGQPVRGEVVRWMVRTGASVSPVVTTTDAAGLAMTLWRPAAGPGADTARAGAGDLEVVFTGGVRPAAVGDVHRGRADYVEYETGSLPLVISAPHGGTLLPDEIPDRTFGTVVRDLETDRLARAIADALEARTGDRPHLILSRLHRLKLDPNREIVEAAQGDPLAEQAWIEFQGFIDHAKERVADAHDDGFYIDLHGHGHPIQRLELGYLLTSSELGRSNAGLGGLALESSVRTLAGSDPGRFVELIRGPLSLGTLLEAEGVPTVPSEAQPDPGGQPYFTGGYNTRRHGSIDGGPISGVQIETHWTGARNTQAARAALAGAVAAVLERFLAEYYGGAG